MSQVTSATSQTNTNAATAAAGKNVLGKDDFMKLLITQMKNQDPMNPADSSQFASQLAQFSSLEQLTNLNQSIQQSMSLNYALTQSINNTMSATLIGKNVKIGGSNIVVNNQSKIELGVDLPADAKKVKIEIYNQNGSVIKTIEKDGISKGDYKLSWDCTDNNSNKIQNGKYTYKVEAVSATGSDMTVTSYIFGSITSVKFSDDGTKLVIDGSEYSLSDISEIINKQ